jgi:hypothetical protein
MFLSKLDKRKRGGGGGEGVCFSFRLFVFYKVRNAIPLKLEFWAKAKLVLHIEFCFAEVRYNS